jgi:hypothetical protein
MDLFDVYIRKQMKLWAGRHSSPQNGRERLLAAASHQKRSENWLRGRLYLKLPAIALKSAAAMIHHYRSPFPASPFMEKVPFPSGRAMFTRSNEMSQGLLNLGLICSANVNSIGIHLRF